MTPAQYAYLIIAVVAAVAALPLFATAFSALVSETNAAGNAYNSIQVILSALSSNAELIAIASIIAAFIYLRLTHEI